MFGPDEYRYTCTELGKLARDVSDTRRYVNIMRADLFDDSIIATQATRDHLRDVSQKLGECLAALDNAAVELPAPVAPDTAAAFRALHGGTA